MWFRFPLPPPPAAPFTLISHPPPPVCWGKERLLQAAQSLEIQESRGHPAQAARILQRPRPFQPNKTGTWERRGSGGVAASRAGIGKREEERAVMYPLGAPSDALPAPEALGPQEGSVPHHHHTRPFSDLFAVKQSLRQRLRQLPAVLTLQECTVPGERRLGVPRRGTGGVRGQVLRGIDDSGASREPDQITVLRGGTDPRLQHHRAAFPASPSPQTAPPLDTHTHTHAWLGGRGSDDA